MSDAPLYLCVGLEGAEVLDSRAELSNLLRRVLSSPHERYERRTS